MKRKAARVWGSLLLAAAAAGLSACSSVNELVQSGPGIDYKSAGKLPPLDVPPDLVNPKGDERFNVPERQQRTYSGYQTSRATERPVAEAPVASTATGMRMERAGSQRWLVVDQPADRLWPQVRDFWQESGFTLSTESPQIGVMETDWAENRAKIPDDIVRRTIGKAIDAVYSTGERDKFRTRFESAPGGGTEIYISHRGMEEVYKDSSMMARDTIIWQPRPADPDLEMEFLRRLMVKLGADQDRSRAAVASVSQPAPNTVQLTVAGDVQRLDVPEGFDRAWRRVGLALDRGGFTVEDRDRSQGVYFVRYLDPELDAETKKPTGLLSRMFSRGDPAAQARQYRVVVTGAADRSQVTVQSRDGQPLASEIDRKTGARILSLLREQLQP
jgi:outer membrane protein assembly factor BamC